MPQLPSLFRFLPAAVLTVCAVVAYAPESTAATGRDPQKTTRIAGAENNPDSLAAPATDKTNAAPVPIMEHDGDSLTVLPEIDSQLFSAGDLIDTTKVLPQDTLSGHPARRDTLIEVQHALRVGIDLAAPLLPLIGGKDDDSGWMVLADYRVGPRLYAAANFGHAERHLNFSSMRTAVDGWYALGGIHYALAQGAFLQKKSGREGLDILYAGVKLGYSKYNRHIYDASIRGDYWGNEYAPDITDNPSALWLDLSMGISVCLWGNVYLSLQGGYDVMVSGSGQNGIGPLVVPGLGQVYNKSTAFSMSYGISYRFPLYKKVHRVRIREKRESINEQRARENTERLKNFTPAFDPVKLLEE